MSDFALCCCEAKGPFPPAAAVTVWLILLRASLGGVTRWALSRDSTLVMPVVFTSSRPGTLRGGDVSTLRVVNDGPLQR